MITRVGFELVRNNKNFNRNNINNRGGRPASMPYAATILPKYGELYYSIPFLGENKDKQNKFQSIMFNADPTFKKMYAQLQSEASKYGYNEITAPIVFNYLLKETLNYVNDLNSGKIDYKTTNCPVLANTMISDYCDNIFEEPEQRKKILPVLQ